MLYEVITRARELIGAWRDEAVPDRDREEVIRLTIEEALISYNFV